MPGAQPRIPVQTILSIAGSDPSGGAGIQADLKTFAAIGVYGGAVITSLTVQNTMGVSGITTLAPELVKEQIRAVLDDLAVSHVKIGMVGSMATAIAITEALAAFSGEVIYDPVLRATSGHPLTSGDTGLAPAEQVASRATVLTPNFPEIALLTGKKVDELSEPAMANFLFDRFPNLKAVALTGGHAPAPTDTITDLLFLRAAEKNHSVSCHPRSHPKISTANSHGTGCTFAAAFAAYHQQTGSYQAAFDRTVAFLSELLKQSARYQIGSGNGPLLHHLHRSTNR